MTSEFKPSSYKLNKDILFKFIRDAGHVCFRCGGELTRNNFSIDHKVPWLGDKEASTLFYDLGNIAYSHNICNTKAARKPNKRLIPRTIEEQREEWAAKARRQYTSEKRRNKYLKYGY